MAWMTKLLLFGELIWMSKQQGLPQSAAMFLFFGLSSKTFAKKTFNQKSEQTTSGNVGMRRTTGL
jgi:hypothetical protein